MPDMDLEKRVEAVEQRNKKVEMDKFWETSNTRRFLIIILAYFTMTLVMYSIGVPDPLVNAIIPTLGFTLSTLSLPYFRKYWENYFYRK